MVAHWWQVGLGDLNTFSAIFSAHLLPTPQMGAPENCFRDTLWGLWHQEQPILR